MRRQRTVVGNPDGSSHSRYVSPRHDARSPRSINSESTFDRSFNTTSVIGHDDPTLVHANIKGTSSGKNEAKSLNSGALDSFLTTSFSDEESRDYVGDMREKENPSSDFILRQQLAELDQRQEAWKARQQDFPIDMDETVDFYLKEVGELSSSSPKKRSLAVVKETMYEEDESRENSIPQLELQRCSDKEVRVGLIADEKSEKLHSKLFNQPTARGSSEFNKTTRYQSKSNRMQEIIAKNLSEHRQQHHPQNFDVTSTPYQAQTNGSMLKQKQRSQSEESGKTKNSEKFGQVDTNITKGFVSIDPSVQKSAGVKLSFEKVSTDEKNILKNNQEALERNDSYADKSSRAIDHSFVDVEGNAEYSSTHANGETKDTNEIIRAVQKRLFYFSSNIQCATESFDSSTHERSAKFSSWLPVNRSNHSRCDSKRKKISSQALASKVDRSRDEDDIDVDDVDVNVNVDVDSGVRHKKRRLKFFLMNTCLAVVIIASIVCTILFFLELKSSRDGNTSFNENSEKSIENKPKEVHHKSTPTESPTYHVSSEKNLSSPEFSEGSSYISEAPSSSPSSFPVQVDLVTDSKLPSQTSSRVSPPVQTQTMSPTVYERSVGDILRSVSGESIYDIFTPQHIAFDWLVNKDPANLDFNSVTEEDLSQRYIAALLYFTMDGGNWFEQHGFLKESHVCEWNNGSSRNKMGIVCNSSYKITGFAINDNNLRGQLPQELKKLVHMTLFQLRANHIGGTIPPGFGRLSLLEEIDLRQNELIGTVPVDIFNLPKIRRILLLRNSQLGGSIPVTIDKASNLEMLSFQKCHITGSIPSAIGNLSKLSFFTFMENMLTGSIPESMTNLSRLKVLELSGNQLTGSIPDLRNQKYLYFLSLYDNKLKGSIPESIGVIPKLMFLDIRDNQLDGSIPSSFGLLPDLVTFFAQNNQLTGRLPSFSGNKGLLQAINFSDNKLSGNLSDFFGLDGPSDSFLTVDLSQNNLQGKIPASVGLYDSLNELRLQGNSLSGTIPKELGGLREMNTLNLRGNNFSGTLPEELGFIEQLKYLNVASNQFEGTIPDTLVLLSKLEVLDVNSNQLVGSIPPTFGQLSNIDELFLNNNSITGDLTEIFCRGYTVDSMFRYIETFVADCLDPEPIVTCKCCTICCKNDNCIP